MFNALQTNPEHEPKDNIESILKRPTSDYITIETKLRMGNNPREIIVPELNDTLANYLTHTNPEYLQILEVFSCMNQLQKFKAKLESNYQTYLKKHQIFGSSIFADLLDQRIVWEVSENLYPELNGLIEKVKALTEINKLNENLEQFKRLALSHIYPDLYEEFVQSIKESKPYIVSCVNHLEIYLTKLVQINNFDKAYNPFTRDVRATPK